MWERWQSDAKIKVTQQVLLHFLDSVPDNSGVEIAMRVFGHLNHNSYGTRLECRFEAGNRYQLQSKIKTLVPNGGCTAATALDDAVGDFPVGDRSRNIIFVITDGSNGGSNICEVAGKIQQSGRVVRTFILNIAAARRNATPDCAGTVVPVENEEMFAGELLRLFRDACSESRVTVSLTTDSGSHYIDDVPIVFYDRQNRKPVYTTIYTGGRQPACDTLTVDPLVDYDVEVYTRPSTVFRNRSFRPGRVYTLASLVEEGRLCVRREDKHVVWIVPDYPVLVRQNGKPDLVSTQMLGDSVKYLVGTYDVEILSTPPIVLNGVEIRKDAVTELAIPAPGMLMIERMRARHRVSIFEMRDGRMQLVRDFTPDVAGHNMVLMPGEYTLLVRPSAKDKNRDTRKLDVRIVAGKQTQIKIE